MQSVDDFVNGLAGSRRSVREAAEALFAVGASSGADLANGLFPTLRQFNVAGVPGERACCKLAIEDFY